MLILGRDTLKDASLGYARTFVRQLEDCLGLALERGVKIVSNAGGLNPAGLADKVREVAKGLGLDVAVAHVEGDDLRGLGLRGRADRQRLPRRLRHRRRAPRRRGRRRHRPGHRRRRWWSGRRSRTFGWEPTSYDELAGAVVAGHVLECGAQATGGNFSGFRSLIEAGMDPMLPLGFPVAEIAADGSSVITKHDGTGGAVTVDTVTAQLVYEIQSHALPQPRRHRPPRLHPARAGRHRPGRDHAACTARRRRSGSRSASTSSAGSATASSSCSPASTSTRRPTGSASS